MAITPAYVMPTFQAAYFDETNVAEILEWLQTEQTGSWPGGIEIWWMINVERLNIAYGNWIVATLTGPGSPPRVAEVLEDDLFRAKYSLLAGPVTAPPPPGGEPVTP